MAYKLVKIESVGAQQERRITHKIYLRGYPDFSSNCAQRAWCLGTFGQCREQRRFPEPELTVPISLHRIVAPICHGIFSRERLACCTLMRHNSVTVN